MANYVFGNEPVGNASPASQGQALYLSATLKGALTSAMANALGEATITMPVGCPTGNCTFPEYGGVTYSTMGLCSICFDTSRLIQHNASHGNTNYSLPNGQSIIVYMQNGVDLSVSAGRMDSSSSSGSSSNEYDQYGYDNITWDSSLFPEGFAELASSSILNVSTLTYTQAPCSDSGLGSTMPSCVNNISTYTVNNTRPFAATCALYPFFQSMMGSVVGGMLQEHVVSTAPASQWLNNLDASNMWSRSMPSFFGRDNFTAVRSPCVVEGSSTTPPTSPPTPVRPKQCPFCRGQPRRHHQ